MLDAGCGPGGTFSYLAEAVGTSGEVVGIEISPEVAINANKRIQVRRWSHVQVVQGDAKTVTLNGEFDGLVLFAAPDVYVLHSLVFARPFVEGPVKSGTFQH